MKETEEVSNFRLDVQRKRYVQEHILRNTMHTYLHYKHYQKRECTYSVLFENVTRSYYRYYYLLIYFNFSMPQY
jgi:hypothetical protein